MLHVFVYWKVTTTNTLSHSPGKPCHNELGYLSPLFPWLNWTGGGGLGYKSGHSHYCRYLLLPITASDRATIHSSYNFLLRVFSLFYGSVLLPSTERLNVVPSETLLSSFHHHQSPLPTLLLLPNRLFILCYSWPWVRTNLFSFSLYPHFGVRLVLLLLSPTLPYSSWREIPLFLIVVHCSSIFFM